MTKVGGGFSRLARQAASANSKVTALNMIASSEPSRRKWRFRTRIFSVLSLACMGALAASPSSETSPASNYKIIKTIPLKARFKTQSDWQVTAYQPHSDRDDVPAQLCFAHRTGEGENCAKITSGLPNEPNFIYNYQTVVGLKIVPLKIGVSAVFFHAEFSGGGSGTSEQISLWTYDAKGDSFWPALVITTNESGQYKVIDSGPLAGYVVTADAVWQLDKGETHFSPHQFEMTAYRLSGQFYLKALSYLTTKKYGDQDSGSPPNDAIDGEMPRVRTLLRAIHQ